MAALGVPTTRALAAVATGERVMRQEGPLPGGVFTRVAASHIRVGTFQYFLARQDIEALRLLADHALARHYPEAAETPTPYLTLLECLVAAQADLVAHWMSLGFIHGVMNTDNTAVSGRRSTTVHARSWMPFTHSASSAPSTPRHVTPGGTNRRSGSGTSPVSRKPCCRCCHRAGAKPSRSPRVPSTDTRHGSAASSPSGFAPSSVSRQRRRSNASTSAWISLTRSRSTSRSSSVG